MWALRQTQTYEKRVRQYARNHPNETVATLNNLDTLHNALNVQVKPSSLQAGYIHREPKGVIALDQKGAKGSPKQTRLYIYPDEDQKIIYLITIGDKRSQKKDIQHCNKFVEDLRKGKIQ